MYLKEEGSQLIKIYALKDQLLIALGIKEINL